MKNTSKMQKYISVALATAMIGSMGITAFAAPKAASPVVAASTRVSAGTEAAREQLKKAEAALKEAETALRDALKAAGMDPNMDISTPAAVDKVIAEAAKEEAKATEAVKKAEKAVLDAGGAPDPDINKKPEVVQARTEWENAQKEVENKKAALAQEEAKVAVPKQEYEAAKAADDAAQKEVEKTTGAEQTAKAAAEQAKKLDEAYKAVTAAVGTGFTSVDGSADSVEALKGQIKTDLAGVDAGLQNQIVDEIVAKLTSIDPVSNVSAENVKTAATAVVTEKGNQATTDAEEKGKLAEKATEAKEAATQEKTKTAQTLTEKQAAYEKVNGEVTKAQQAVAEAERVEKEKKQKLDDAIRDAAPMLPAARLAVNFDDLNNQLQVAKDKEKAVKAVGLKAGDVKAKQADVKAAQDVLSGQIKNEKYTVKKVKLGDKVADNIDGDRYLYYLLTVDGFGIKDNGSGKFVKYDDIKDIDDLKLSVKITSGEEYVKDYYIDEIDSASKSGHKDEYAVIIKLKDNNTTKKQKIKGTITIKNKTKKLDDVDFSYNYDIDVAKPEDLNKPGMGDCEFDKEDVRINLIDFNKKYKVADFKKEVKNIELEDNNGFYFDVKASDQGKLNLSFDNTSIKSVVRNAPTDADLTFYNFYGYPTFDFTGKVTITPDDNADEYYLYYVDKNDKLKRVNTKVNDDGDALEFKTRTLGRYVLSDMKLDTDDRNDKDDNSDITGQPSGPVEDTTMPGGTIGGKPNPGTGL